jgi:hypothetical protein
MLAAAPRAPAQQVCPFLMRQQFQLQLQMQQQRFQFQQTLASRFQQPVFQPQQQLTPRFISQPSRPSLSFQGPRFQRQQTTFVRPVTRTVEGSRFQLQRTSYRIEECFHPEGSRFGHEWSRFREGSTYRLVESRFRFQETHLQRFTQDRLTVQPPSVMARKPSAPRFLQTVPDQRLTAGRRAAETEQKQRFQFDTHRPLVQLRSRFSASCGDCHSQPPAPTFVSRPDDSRPLAQLKRATPSLVRRPPAPEFVAPRRAAAALVVGPRQPLLPAVLTPNLLAGVVRPPQPAAGPGPGWRMGLLAPPALPALVQGLARVDAPRPQPGMMTHAPGERSPGETEMASPRPASADADLLRSAPALPPLEGSLVLAAPASGRGALTPAKAVERELPLPEDLAQGPPLPPLPGRSPLLMGPPAADEGRPRPAAPALDDLIVLAPALPPLPDEAPPPATHRE